MREGACGDPIYCGAGFYFGGVWYDEIPAWASLQSVPDFQISPQVIPAYQVLLKELELDPVELCQQ